MTETPAIYGAMGERGFVRWTLDYTMEWFIMTIQHQNYHYGQLATIEAMLR